MLKTVLRLKTVLSLSSGLKDCLKTVLSLSSGLKDSSEINDSSELFFSFKTVLRLMTVLSLLLGL